MADTATPASKAAPATTEKKCCAWSDWSWAAILFRICAAMLLIMSGLDKFKSNANPASYSLENYYGTEADNAKGVPAKLVKIINVSFTNSGLDNPATFGEKKVNLFSWAFYGFGYALPWLMLGSGFMILFGIFSRLGHFIGGMVWISLIVGQLMLPDYETVVRLLVIFVVSTGALALQSHNRFCVTKG